MALEDIAFPFETDSETEVLVALAAFFHDLGFTRQELSFEDSFRIRLGHTVLDVTKQAQRVSANGRSDMLLVRMGMPLAVVETKAPHIALTDEDRDQGLSYARLLRNMPPFTIVTNGEDLRIYDTITAELISSGRPSDSVWARNGQSFAGFGASEQDRAWAARTLVAQDINAVRQYCRAQVERNMADLRGAPNEQRRYWPGLYVPRIAAQETFTAFLASNDAVLAITGESGLGKTNELCALAERLSQGDGPLPLFYRGSQLWDGLARALREDFEWEFERDEPLSRILRRYDEIAAAHQTLFIVIIDGIDETPRDLALLAAELRELVSRIDAHTVRLCISCKSHDWARFAQERYTVLNSLGRRTFPPGPDADSLPGLELGPLVDSELEAAWIGYRDALGVPGELAGETREACRMPLMLRLVALTYAGGGDPIPEQLSDLAILDGYWSRRMAEFDLLAARSMERLIGRAAETMIATDRAELDEGRFYNAEVIGDLAIRAYDDVLRYGLLSRARGPGGATAIIFPLDQLRLYAYTIKARRWPDLTDPALIAQEIQRAMDTRLGLEALRFFLSVDLTGADSWIVPLIEHSPVLALRLLREVRDLRPLSQGIAAPAAHLSERLSRFIQVYARLRDSFPALLDRLAPYTLGRAGLWLNPPWHGYRTVTSELPHALVQLDDEGTRLLWHNRLSEESQHALQPSNPKNFSNLLWSQLQRSIPETVALSEFTRQLTDAVRDRILDESGCKHILAERIHHTLESRIAIVVPEGPQGACWQNLGFASLDEAQRASCDDLSRRANALVGQWTRRQAATTDFYVRNSYHIHIREIVILDWYVKQLSKSSSVLPAPSPSRRQLLGYLFGDGAQTTAEALLSLAPTVVSELATLIERNFTSVAGEFVLYRLREARLVLELCLSRRQERSRSWDTTSIIYMWLPSAPPGPASIHVCNCEESITEQYLRRQSLSTSQSDAELPIELSLDGRMVREANPHISRIDFPNDLVLTEQIYRLLINEGASVFGDRFAWFRAKYPGRDCREAALLQMGRRMVNHTYP